MHVSVIEFEFDLIKPIQAVEGDQVHLRLFTMDDAHLIYQWRSHPIVRQHALDDRLFSYEHHHQWCEKKDP